MQKKFKIGYFADGPWSHKAFDYLISDETISVEFIVPRTDTEDNTLKSFSDQYGIKYLHPVNINSEKFYSEAQEFDCDLFVSMSFNQIFRKEIIGLPRFNTINCHAGKLPFYRGRNILNWALINNESEFGITVHFVDEGIDTGDIILQETYPISEEDDYKTLLEAAYVGCAEILYKAIKMIQSGDFTPIKQESVHPVGFYCGRRSLGDEIIDWNQNSRDIFNFIRAICHPGPKATTFLGEKKITINKARLIPEAPIYKNTSGQLLNKTSGGFLVKTLDSFIEILEIESEVKLKVGDKLG
ncbi:methionyl-tRNA formyltransferase [Marinoscillum furvescens]|uniref:Methionyl-tRNA formyltransferase n=1 Tax=Marinoscillum furvescens DSM 4134 TaxID=1122208 RepID=A0A3D9L6Y3_MARFU|nr:methionyl-tRNA formyltransferase [Marinoscillum furvescens]REE01641.1 methionyl-tRNA formyltransferase [Marinoscillum furvescens DSM 4134]